MFADQFQDLCAPLEGSNYGFSHNTTQQLIEVPEEFKGGFVMITSQTADLFVNFGSANVSVASAGVATVVSNKPSPHWQTGGLVPAGATRSFPVPKFCTHFAYVSSVAGGVFVMERGSGTPQFGFEPTYDDQEIPTPFCWLDAARYDLFEFGTQVKTWRDKISNFAFTQSTGANQPTLTRATGIGSGIVRPAVAFDASNDALACTDPALIAALDGTDSFSVSIYFRRTAATALHTLLSVGRDASADGRWDITADASDRAVMTRVDTASASTNSLHASSLSAGGYLQTWTFDGSTPLYWKNRVSSALTGTAAGDVGTASRVTVGGRGYNSTVDQWAAMQLCDLVIWNRKLDVNQVAAWHAFMARRAGI